MKMLSSTLMKKIPMSLLHDKSEELCQDYLFLWMLLHHWMVSQFDWYNGKREECVTAQLMDKLAAKVYSTSVYSSYKGMQLVSSHLAAKVWSGLGLAHAK